MDECNATANKKMRVDEFYVPRLAGNAVVESTKSRNKGEVGIYGEDMAVNLEAFAACAS